MTDEKIEILETKYRDGVLKAKEMMETSQTPGAYMGYKSQGELMAIFLFDLNAIREHPKELKDVLP